MDLFRCSPEFLMAIVDRAETKPLRWALCRLAAAKIDDDPEGEVLAVGAVAALVMGAGV